MTDDITYAHFEGALIDELKALTEGTGITMSGSVGHRNNCETDRLVFRIPGEACCPVVYPDDLYRRYLNAGMPVNALAGDVFYQVVNGPHLGFDTSSINVESAAEHVRLAVCGYDANRQWLHDEGIPHEVIADGAIAAYPRWFIDDGASFAVTGKIASHMYLTSDEIMQLASTGTREAGMELMCLGDMVYALTGESTGAGCPMTVAKLNGSTHGAAVLAEPALMEEISRYMEGTYGADNGYLIIPSSVHELIVVPDGVIGAGELDAVIRDVNANVVDVTDRLYDRALAFRDGRLMVAGRDANAGVTAMDSIAEMIDRHERRLRHV